VLSFKDLAPRAEPAGTAYSETLRISTFGPARSNTLGLDFFRQTTSVSHPFIFNVGAGLNILERRLAHKQTVVFSFFQI